MLNCSHCYLKNKTQLNVNSTSFDSFIYMKATLGS